MIQFTGKITDMFVHCIFGNFGQICPNDNYFAGNNYIHFLFNEDTQLGHN
jgi:hypothetical protein